VSRKRCVACGELFNPCRNVPSQTFCSKPECQRERRRRWQRDKLKQDTDYQANQAAAQKHWRERHPEYWRNYRLTHPEYTSLNRKKQHKRNQRRQRAVTGPSPPIIANMNEYLHKKTPESGTYRLVPLSTPEIANMDEYLVKIQVLSSG
jgi:hypothetical protein